jgi:hypothetical protein
MTHNSVSGSVSGSALNQWGSTTLHKGHNGVRAEQLLRRRFRPRQADEPELRVLPAQLQREVARGSAGSRGAHLHGVRHHLQESTGVEREVPGELSQPDGAHFQLFRGHDH